MSRRDHLRPLRSRLHEALFYLDGGRYDGNVPRSELRLTLDWLCGRIDSAMEGRRTSPREPELRCIADLVLEEVINPRNRPDPLRGARAAKTFHGGGRL